MAIKDFNTTENEHHESKKIDDKKQEQIKSPQKNENNGEQTEVKNAHATGDGSFGSNESRLPDAEVKQEEGGAAY